MRQDIEAVFEFLGLLLSLRTPYTPLATLHLLCYTSCSSNPTKKMVSNLAYFSLGLPLHWLNYFSRFTSVIVQAVFILGLAADVLWVTQIKQRQIICFRATVTPSSREKSASVVSSSARLKNKGLAVISVFWDLNESLNLFFLCIVWVHLGERGFITINCLQNIIYTELWQMEGREKRKQNWL